MLLAGCSAIPKKFPTAPAAAPEHPPVLMPDTLGARHSAQQVLRVAFGEHEAVLNCVVAARPQNLQVVVLTALGLRALSLDWDGHSFHDERAPLVPAQFQPAQLVADLQFALWPSSVLQPAYQAQGWALSEPGGGVRRLRRSGQLFAEVHYADAESADRRAWNGRFWLVNFRYGYSLAIESREAAAQ
jgi:hypothetical protein